MKIFLLLLLNFSVIFSGFSQTNGDWTELGPKDFPPHLNWQLSGVARISQMKFHPTDPNTLYAINAMGGIFISHDKGDNWISYGTDNLPQTRCASVCIDYTNDQIAYLGTGDPSYYSQGLGIWKTLDGGNTWNPANNGIGNRMAVEILMSDKDHNVLIAATNDGLWKTIDGGINWTLKKSGGDFTNMAFKPVPNTSTIYATTHTEFWKSTNMGDSWTKISLPGNGILDGGRIAVTKADTSIVYVSFVGDFASGFSTPVLKSTNSGASFVIVRVAGLPNYNGYDGASKGQGNYNYSLSADPFNANNLFIVGHIIWKSTNGGVSWTQISNSWASQVHTDMRQVPYSPYVQNEVYNINDGGIWRSWNNGTSWLPLCNGLMGTESYIGCQSPLKKDEISIGAQDNGEFVFSNGIWYINGAGDYHSNIIHDNLSPDYYYDLSTTGRRRGLPFGNSYSLNLPFNAGNGQSVQTDFPQSNTAVCFLGYKDVFRSVNIASNPPIWNKITNINADIKAITTSPTDANTLYIVTGDGRLRRSDNALAATPVFTLYSTPASTYNNASIVVLKNDDNIVYLVCNSKVYRSANKGATWTDVSSNLPNVNYHKILHDQFSSNEAIYLAGYNSVLYKDNTMTNWVNYSKGLPSIVSFFKIYMYNDGTDNSELTVITAGRGVWHTGLYGKTPVLRIPENPEAIIPGIVFKNFEGTWINMPNFNSLTPTKEGTVEVPTIDVRSREDNFGLAFDGYIDAPRDGKYTFYLNTDDGSQLYIGEELLINSDGIHISQEKSGYIWLKKGKHKFTLNYFNSTATKTLTFSWDGPGFTKQAVSASALYRLSPVSECPGNGSILVERWNNISGTNVDSIPVSTPPSTTYNNPNFESKTDDGNGFGVRYRGYICPPYTGNYTFYVSSDDNSELWLSTTGDPANKVKIAHLEGYVNQRDWYSNPSQKSVKIYLVAGQKYYVEALHKDAEGGNNFAVAWIIPSGEFEAPLLGKHLSPFVKNIFPTVSVTAPVNNYALLENNDINVTANAADADGTITKVEFYLDNIKVGEDLSSPYNWIWTAAKAQSTPYSLTVRAIDNIGAVTVSAPLKVTVTSLRVPENPTTTKAGLDYKYYEGVWTMIPDFSLLTPLKTGSVTNFDFSVRNREDNFGIVFTGYIDVALDSIYTFYSKSDDGTKLYIGSTPVIINDGIHTNTNEVSGVIGLKAGKHAFRLEYFNSSAAKGIDISYAGPSLIKSLIPNSTLYSDLNSNTPPTVSVTSNASTAILPAAFTLTANATDADGSIQKVEFYANNSLIGDANSVPFTINYKDLAKGAYTIIAKAIDNQGLSTASTPITITVTGNDSPVSTIVWPVNNAKYVKGTNNINITVNANATDADGTIQKVEFYNGANKLGEVLTSPYSWNMTNVAIGEYNITAKAYDNNSTAMTSNSVNFKVAALAADITDNGGTITSEYAGDATNSLSNLIENDITGKYSATTPGTSLWFQYHSTLPAILTSYSFVTTDDAKDNPVKNPKNWTVTSSKDGKTWTKLDTRTAQSFSDSYEKKDFTVVPVLTSNYIKVNITGVTPGNSIQLAELLLNGYQITLDSTDLTDNGGTLTAQYSNTAASLKKLIDNDAATIYSATVASGSAWIEYVSKKAVTLNKYSITASDSLECSPKSWALYGSNDNKTWTVLDKKSSQTFMRYGTKEYSITTDSIFTSYKLTLLSPQSGTLYEIADWQLFSNDPDNIDFITSDICTYYPNPATTELNINFNQVGNHKVEIFDEQGKRTFSKIMNSNETIKVATMPSGIYVLKIYYKDKIYTGKFIKD